MREIPMYTTHLEVTDSGANFWSISVDGQEDGTGEVWIDGKWMASEISDRLMQRLISFTPLQLPEPWGPNDIIPLGEGSITGEAYRRGVEAGRRTPVKVVADVTGGALHGIYAEQPVEVLFISYDSDDIESQQEGLDDGQMASDFDGEPVASWLQTSSGHEAEAKVVQHYFEQVDA